MVHEIVPSTREEWAHKLNRTQTWNCTYNYPLDETAYILRVHTTETELKLGTVHTETMWKCYMLENPEENRQCRTLLTQFYMYQWSKLLANACCFRGDVR